MKKWLFIFLIIPSLLFAKQPEKAPKEYEKGKLVDIQSENRSIFLGATSYAAGNQIYTHANNANQVLYNFMVQLKSMLYQGVYVRKNVFQYKPDDFVVNDPIEVRLDEKNRMYIKRPDGKELKTKIVRRERLQSKSVK